MFHQFYFQKEVCDFDEETKEGQDPAYFEKITTYPKNALLIDLI